MSRCKIASDRLRNDSSMSSVILFTPGNHLDVINSPLYYSIQNLCEHIRREFKKSLEGLLSVAPTIASKKKKSLFKSLLNNFKTPSSFRPCGNTPAGNHRVRALQDQSGRRCKIGLTISIKIIINIPGHKLSVRF